jgi:hypothetical protein
LPNTGTAAHLAEHDDGEDDEEEHNQQAGLAATAMYTKCSLCLTSITHLAEDDDGKDDEEERALVQALEEVVLVIDAAADHQVEDLQPDR